MPAGEYFETVMRHHLWAVDKLLGAAALVPAPQLEAEGLSHGSILSTLRHVADVDQSWGRTAQGLPQASGAEDVNQCADLASLRNLWRAEDLRLLEFASGLSDADLERDVQPPWRRQPRKVWQILLHISNHRAEHGNQIGWQLTALGHSPGEMGFMGLIDSDSQGR